MIRYFWPSDDEQLAGQVQRSFEADDADWWVGAQKAGAIVALAAVLSITAASTALATSVFSQAQDDPALVVQILAGEDYWQNPVAPVNWPQPSVLTDDDVHPTFVQTFTPDDGDYWHQLVPPVPATNYVQLPLIDTEITPHFTPAVPVTDDSSVWGPLLPPREYDWTLLFFLDDGSTVPIFQYDEDFWAPRIPPQNWPQPQQAFSDTDENVPNFVSAEDPVWQQLVQPVPDTLRLLHQFQFEQNESTNLIAFVEDVFWQNPTPPVPASLALLQQWPFEQNEPAGSLNSPAFEETLWQNPTAPVADSLRLQQQWVFEQNEPGNLRTNFDEDFWANPVAPYVWPQPSSIAAPALLIADEVVQTFVGAFQPDEDFWPNLAFFPAPVAAALYVPLPAQPFNFEEGTPALVAPIPPPPFICPGPPLGPDGDIIENYFGGNKNPQMVLFCRTCMSGKPLLVRGDYAIWCQDCCRFVSKQETYMGTTRAPGQLKSIF